MKQLPLQLGVPALRRSTAAGNGAVRAWAKSISLSEGQGSARYSRDPDQQRKPRAAARRQLRPVVRNGRGHHPTARDRAPRTAVGGFAANSTRSKTGAARATTAATGAARAPTTAAHSIRAGSLAVRRASSRVRWSSRLLLERRRRAASAWLLASRTIALDGACCRRSSLAAGLTTALFPAPGSHKQQGILESSAFDID